MYMYVYGIYLKFLMNFFFPLNLLWGTDDWRSRWVISDWKRSEGKAGTFKHTAGKWHGDPDDKGTVSNCWFPD